jgi:predicted nucleic acid-binding protein
MGATRKILVDTSAWIAFFRGHEPLASRVDLALDADEAALCGPVLTEIHRGLVRPADRKKVLPLLASCHLLPTPPDLWVAAGDLGSALRRKGVSVKTLELLIATCALHTGATVLTSDGDFALMQGAGVPLALL